MVTGSRCFLSLEVESFVPAAAKRAVWEGCGVHVQCKRALRWNKLSWGQGSLESRVHALTVPQTLIILDRRLLLP